MERVLDKINEQEIKINKQEEMISEQDEKIKKQEKRIIELEASNHVELQPIKCKIIRRQFPINTEILLMAS